MLGSQEADFPRGGYTHPPFGARVRWGQYPRPEGRPGSRSLPIRSSSIALKSAIGGRLLVDPPGGIKSGDKKGIRKTASSEESREELTPSLPNGTGTLWSRGGMGDPPPPPPPATPGAVSEKKLDWSWVMAEAPRHNRSADHWDTKPMREKKHVGMEYCHRAIEQKGGINPYTIWGSI